MHVIAAYLGKAMFPCEMKEFQLNAIQIWIVSLLQLDICIVQCRDVYLSL